MSEQQKSYEDGMRDGKIKALESIAAQHEDRLRTQERITWALIGIIGFVQFWPSLSTVLATAR